LAELNVLEQKSLENLEFGKVLNLIAGFAGSKAAQDSIRRIIPSTDVREIEKRLSELDELSSFLDSGKHLPIGGIREMRDLLSVLQKGEQTLSGDELLRVRNNIEVSIAVKRAFSDVGNFPLLKEAIAGFPDFSHETSEIAESISERGEVKDAASPRLSGIRKELSKALQEIENRLNQYLSLGADFFQDRYFTIRNDRFVVPVKTSCQNSIQGIVHDQSGSGQTLFIEPLEFLGLNNRISRLKAEEREEIKRILVSLTAMLAAREAELSKLFETIVFFDVLHAKAKFSRKFDCRRIGISSDRNLLLKNARHPLLHPECVPMTVSITKDNSCLVITGPNGGGKTVALKIIGVACLLMQIGCYVPASADSRVPVFDQILSDIGESQSI